MNNVGITYNGDRRFLDHDDEPGYFFKGAVLGFFFFCLPVWIIIFLLIT